MDSLKRLILPSVLRAARFYIRYAPVSLFKEPLWKWCERRRPIRFSARTLFRCTFSGSTADVIQNRIYFFGLWEPYLTAWLERHLREGDVFVDIGANVGYHSLLASRLVGESGRVFAIEASPSIFKVLTRNIRTNAARNITALHLAAGCSSGHIEVFRDPARDFGESGQWCKDGFVSEGDVTTGRVADNLPPAVRSRVRIIKIDIEGAEYDAILGLGDLSRFTHPELEIVVEVTPSRLSERGVSVQQVVEHMAGFGFRGYLLPNEYRGIRSYVARHIAPTLMPLNEMPRAVTDVLFSRRAVSTLT